MCDFSITFENFMRGNVSRLCLEGIFTLRIVLLETILTNIIENGSYISGSLSKGLSHFFASEF